MPKLTDAQLIILNAAAVREDGAALPLPTSLKTKGAAATKTLESLRKKGLLEERPAGREDEAWRTDEDGRHMALVLTGIGLEALEVGPVDASPQRGGQAKGQPKQSRPNRNASKGTPKSETPKSAARRGTKQALLIDLLERKTGATIDEIVEATSWQAHSVRGAISGTLKKKLGLTVSSEKTEGRGRVYRIAG